VCFFRKTAQFTALATALFEIGFALWTMNADEPVPVRFEGHPSFSFSADCKYGSDIFPSFQIKERDL